MAIDPNVAGFGQVHQTYAGNAAVGSLANKVLFLDELSPAERKDLLEVIYAAQNPALIPPNLYSINNNDPNAIASVGLSINQSQHNTIMEMLDSWIENVKQIKEESERADLKRMIDGVSIAFHSYQHSVSPTLDKNFPTFSVGVVLGAIGIHEAFVSTPLTQVAMNPIIDMAVTAVPQVLGDMRAELGLLGAFVIFGFGLQYASAAGQARNDANQKMDEKAAAKNFAEQVMSAISDEGFNTYLMAIVSQSSTGGQPLTDQGQAQSVAIIKIMLLSLALAALYNAEAGAMTGDEFVAMFKDPQKDPSAIVLKEGDPKQEFIDGIKSLMSILDENQIRRFYESMMEYFDSRPSISDLMNPSKSFSAIGRTVSRDELPA